MIRRIAEIMTMDPVTIDVTTNLETVVDIIKKEGYSHVPVTENKKLVGIVSKSDLVKQFIKMLDETTGKHYTKMLMEHIPVMQVMHRKPITVRRGDDIDFAIELLLQGKFHGLVVISDDNEVQGIVTAYDLLLSMSSDKTK